MCPEQQPGDFERLLWKDVPHELEGRVVVSLAELEKLIPDTRSPHIVALPIQPSQNYILYGRRVETWHQRLAYQCNHCHQIVIGPPSITDDNSIKLGIPLCGREGYNVNCTNCEYELAEHTFAVSLC